MQNTKHKMALARALSDWTMNLGELKTVADDIRCEIPGRGDCVVLNRFDGLAWGADRFLIK